VIDFIRANTPRDSLVMSFKPSDLYYAQRKMLNHGDPRLVEFYTETSPRAAAERLRGLGVTHVHVADYDLPTFYNSAAQEILRDPTLTTLLKDDGGYQLYALAPAHLEEGRRIDMVGPGMGWSRVSQVVIGGRLALASIGFGAELLVGAVTSDATEGPGLFHRDRSTSLVAEAVPVLEENEYALDLEIEGRGLVRVWLRGHGDTSLAREPREAMVTRFMIGDTFLSDAQPLRSLGFRFRAPRGVTALTLELEHIGSSKLSVGGAALIDLQPMETDPVTAR
jgi:hypothetical protein